MVALTGVGTLVTAACFYPGYLNGDSNWQYAQGVSGEYDALQPVAMSWLMGRLDGLVEGSGGIFLLMTVGFWAGLGGALRAFTSSVGGFWIAAALIGTSIPVFSMLSQVHKDLGVVVGLLGAFVLLVEGDRRRSLRALLCALPLLWYATAVRHNGAAAVLPFALYLGWLIARDQLPPALATRFRRPWLRIALGCLILAALFSTSLLVTRLTLGKAGKRTPAEQFVMAYDLFGISVRAGRSFVSDVYYPQQPFTLPELRAMYRSDTHYFLNWGPPGQRRVPVTRSPEVIASIRRAWLDAVAAEPAAYLAHRLRLFLALIGVEPVMPRQTIQFAYRGFDYDYRGPTVFELPHARAVVRFFEACRSTLLFRAWPYLLVGLLALAFAWLRPNRHRLPVTLLAASSLIYLAPMFFIISGAQFRYTWWPILAAMLQVTLAITGSRATGPARPNDAVVNRQPRRRGAAGGQPASSAATSARRSPRSRLNLRGRHVEAKGVSGSFSHRFWRGAGTRREFDDGAPHSARGGDLCRIPSRHGDRPGRDDRLRGPAGGQ